MKKKKLREIIQRPLRFHHQDIHEELEEIKLLLYSVLERLNEQEQKQ
jgi:hypothetical protein